MKRIYSLICVAGFSLFAALAQQPLPGQPGFGGPGGLGGAPLTNTPTRMSIDFSGGKPAVLLKVMKEAASQEPNVIIHPEATDLDIPPFSLRNVTAAQVFGALNMLGSADRTGIWQIVNSQDGEIWTLMPDRRAFSIDPTTGIPMMNNGYPAASGPPPNRTCRIFNLTPVLDDYTVEDVTTAVKGAWELLALPEQPTMKYHKDTKLLIAVGEPNQLSVVNEVISSLRQNIQHRTQQAGAPSNTNAAPAKVEEKR